MNTAPQELRLLNVIMPEDGTIKSYKELGEQLSKRFSYININKTYTNGQIKYLVSKCRELRKTDKYSLLLLTTDLPQKNPYKIIRKQR